MEVIGKKIENQVQFWSLLGPFLVLLSIAVLLFKVSAHWYFPVSGLIGIPLCVRWKMKGLVAALFCLLLLSGIGYQTLDLEDRYWHVGLALTMAFSFIILTLSLEEAEGLVGKLQLESQSRLDNFALLGDKWKAAEHEWVTEKEKFQIEITYLNQELSKAHEEKQTFYKIAQLSKEELIQTREQHELLLKDILYKKQQIVQIQERLDENEMTIQSFVNSDSEKLIQVLQKQIKEHEEKIDFQSTIVKEHSQTLKEKQNLQLENQTIKDQCQTKNEELKQAKAEIEAQKELISRMQVFHIQLQKQKERAETEIHELKQKISEQMEAVKVQFDQALLGEEELNNIRNQYEKDKNDLLRHNSKQTEDLQQLKLDLKFKTDALESSQKQTNLLNVELKNVQEDLQTKIQKIRELQEVIEKQQKQFQQQFQENPIVQSDDSDYSSNEKLPYALGNTRRIEGMYIQLKNQFEEKSAVLDATRRELFQANEQLLKRQKEIEEEKVFGQSNLELYYQSSLLECSLYYEKALKEHQKEIDELSQLVNVLFHQLDKDHSEKPQDLLKEEQASKTSLNVSKRSKSRNR